MAIIGKSPELRVAGGEDTGYEADAWATFPLKGPDDFDLHCFLCVAKFQEDFYPKLPTHEGVTIQLIVHDRAEKNRIVVSKLCPLDENEYYDVFLDGTGYHIFPLFEEWLTQFKDQLPIYIEVKYEDETEEEPTK